MVKDLVKMGVRLAKSKIVRVVASLMILFVINVEITMF